MTATSLGNSTVIYPVVVVEVQGVKCRALLDTGAGSSYASAALIDHLKIRPHQREARQIEVMMGVVSKPVELFNIKVSSLKRDFTVNTEVTKVHKRELLSLENPRYKQCLDKYEHLKGVEMDDLDTKDILPVHLILGVSDYARIKTETAPRIGALNEPIAEKTKLGWTIISPGKEVDLTPMFMTQTSSLDYETLCRLEVLISRFKEQLINEAKVDFYQYKCKWSSLYHCSKIPE